MADQFCFQLALVERFGECEEVEDVRVFEGLLGEVGLGTGHEWDSTRGGPQQRI